MGVVCFRIVGRCVGTRYCIQVLHLQEGTVLAFSAHFFPPFTARPAAAGLVNQCNQHVLTDVKHTSVVFLNNINNPDLI